MVKKEIIMPSFLTIEEITQKYGIPAQKIYQRGYKKDWKIESPKSFLTVKEVAEIFGYSVQAIYKWIENGLTWCKVSEHGTRVRPENLLKWLRGRGDSEGESRVEDYFFNQDKYKKHPFENENN